jgi:hypothetical protein
MSNDIQTLADLRRKIHDALREQNRQWIDPNGESSICESYDARFADLLARLCPSETQTGRVTVHAVHSN